MVPGAGGSLEGALEVGLTEARTPFVLGRRMKDRGHFPKSLHHLVVHGQAFECCSWGNSAGEADFDARNHADNDWSITLLDLAVWPVISIVGLQQVWQFTGATARSNDEPPV